MKKNITAIGMLILLLTVAMLSGCIQERYTIDEKGIGKEAKLLSKRRVLPEEINVFKS